MQPYQPTVREQTVLVILTVLVLSRRWLARYSLDGICAWAGVIAAGLLV